MNEIKKIKNDLIEEDKNKKIHNLLEEFENGISAVKNNSDYNRSNRDICNNCNSNKFFKRDNNTVCDTCLSIYKTDTTDEKITYNEERTYNQLFTNVRNQVMLSGYQNNRVNKIFKWISIPYKERSLNNVFRDILNKYMDYIKNNKLLISNEIAKDSIAETIKLYTYVSADINHRNPLKTGIIAVCFQYVQKDNHIIWSKKDLSEIFKINIKHITKGNNIINKLCQRNQEFRNRINRDPITLIDLVNNLENKFPELEIKDINNIKKIAKRIINSPQEVHNTPGPILSGILNRYIDVFQINLITTKDIIKRLSVSSSSVTKYSIQLEYAIYDTSTYYL